LFCFAQHLANKVTLYSLGPGPVVDTQLQATSLFRMILKLHPAMSDQVVFPFHLNTSSLFILTHDTRYIDTWMKTVKLKKQSTYIYMTTILIITIRYLPLPVLFCISQEYFAKIPIHTCKPGHYKARMDYVKIIFYLLPAQIVLGQKIFNVMDCFEPSLKTITFEEPWETLFSPTV